MPELSQKTIFLTHEADEWYERNFQYASTKDYSQDSFVLMIQKIMQSQLSSMPVSVLEVGCGCSHRLQFLKKLYGESFHISTIDPSQKAVDNAKKCGFNAYQATADDLPFQDKQFDIVIFGFCLYLCDREDLFKIAYEADRVLKDHSWLVIQDFHSGVVKENQYHHCEGVKSYKMDYSKLFSWNPSYQIFSQSIYHHVTQEFSDSQNDWVATIVFRKNTYK